MKNYYEILNIDKNATHEELKKSYRKLILKLHPDKCGNDSQNHEAFLEIQEAYQVLTKNRTTYNKALKAGGNAECHCPDLDLSGCLHEKYYGNDETLFYKKYGSLFDLIVKHELEFSLDIAAERYKLFLNFPKLGSLGFPNDEVKKFYRLWERFGSQKTFSFADKWDLIEAQNRTSRRQMKQENNFLRTEAKIKFNRSVRLLVAWVKKRDSRFNLILAEKYIKNSTGKVEEDAVGHGSLSNDSQAKNEITARRTACMLQKEHITQKKHTVYLNDVEKTNHSDNTVFEKEDEVAEISLEEKLYYKCDLCNKLFSTPGQFRNHANSIKHRRRIIEYLKSLELEQDISNLNEVPGVVKDRKEISVKKGESSIILDNEIRKGYSTREAKEALDNNSTCSEPTQIEITETKKREFLGKETQNSFQSSNRECFSMSNNLQSQSESSSDEESFIRSFAKIKANADKDNVEKLLECKTTQFDTDEKTNIEFHSEVKITCGRKNKQRLSSVPQFIPRKQEFNGKVASKSLTVSDFICLVCKTKFPSKNKLFAHISTSNHATVENLDTTHGSVKQGKSKKKDNDKSRGK